MIDLFDRRASEGVIRSGLEIIQSGFMKIELKLKVSDFLCLPKGEMVPRV